MGKLRNRVIAEQRVYEDPKHPKTSNYERRQYDVLRNVRRLQGDDG